MADYYKAPWGWLLKFITFGLWTFTVIFIYYNPEPVTILILGSVVVVPAFFMIRGYSLEDHTLIVHRLGWKKEIDLSSLQTVRVDPQAMKWSWRVLGNGGLYGFIGRYRNRRLGSYRAYSTRRKNCVVIELEDDKLVITPDNPESFAWEMRSLLKVRQTPK